MTLIFNQTVTVTSGSSLCFKVDTNATYGIDNVRIISKNGDWLRPSLRGRCLYPLFDHRVRL